jgi:monofunctional chorismate mutase
MKARGLRGAITVTDNTAESIYAATKSLISEMMKKNDIKVDDICFIMFSATSDLNAAFPASAAREMGLGLVPMLDVAQLEVEGSLERCIRVLMVFNTDKKMEDIKHVYLEGAVRLRPDLAI